MGSSTAIEGFVKSFECIQIIYLDSAVFDF